MTRHSDGKRETGNEKRTTYPLQQTLHLFKPIFERLDVALWRTAFLRDFDIRALELVRTAV